MWQQGLREVANMTKTRRQLSLFVIALALMLAFVPGIAWGEEYDGWYEDESYETYDEESWYDDSDYEAWYDEADDDESYYEDDYADEYYEDEYADEWYDDSSSEDDYDESWYEDDESWYEEDAEYDESYTSYSSGACLFGIDVSEWNGTIDWERVSASGADFAILKCGGADDWNGYYTDSEFYRNASACESLGIPYGIYFYSDATSYWEGAAEASYVLSVISGTSPSLPVFIDLEQPWMGTYDYASTLTDISYAFCNTIASGGYYPGIYASSSWWDALLTDSGLDMWTKWVAQYNDYLDYADADIWQCSRWGTIDGIDWPVDLNYWYV